MVYRGTFKNGVVVLDKKVKLADGQRVRVDVEQEVSSPAPNTFSQKLLELSGSCSDLPSDMSENHDHYLYGVPKRKKKR